MVNTLHSGIIKKLGNDLTVTVMEFCKHLIALDIDEDEMVEEYTNGGKSGVVEACLFFDGYYICEFTGKRYELSEVTNSIEDFERELARNATHALRNVAFNQFDAKLGGPDDDDTEYVFV